MDKSPENPEEDTVSLKSNGEKSSNGSAKLGMLQSFRTSIRRVAEKSLLSSGRKGSKVTTADESRLQVPPSPSLSADSPVMSPLKTIGGLFQSTQDNQSDIDAQKGKSLSRSKTDPNISAFGDSLIKKGASIRRSLTFRKNRSTRGQLITVSEGSAEDRKEERQEEEEEDEEVREEMEESYTLPEIPHTPLSVMQINKLIEMEVLEEAHLNLLALRHEFQQQQARCGEDSPMELAKKEKDLNLLYSELRNKINAIVRDSNSLPSRNKGLLVPVARIIQEEESRVEEPGGLQGGWMETWREAVGEGVKVKVESIHLECKDQNASWLAVHLGLLGKAIVEDLEKVKRELRWSYPPSFSVFSTYVRSYHKVVGQHLKKLEPQVTELKDLHILLDWIINRYRSERIMGSVSLQPDMKDESVALQLEDDLLKQLKDKYCCRVKEDMRSSLDRLIQLENEEFWAHSRIPEKDDDGFFNSQVHMDVWTKVKGNIVNTRLIDAQLEQEVISCCLIELKEFPKRFETEFRHLCSAVRPQPLWTQYHITYINSFTALQEHMDVYKDTSPQEVRAFRKEAECLIIRLIQELEEQFKEEVKGFADRMHHHVVREYIGQLMKSNYSCKNRKHEKAASKMRVQCGQLRDLFDDMKSSCEWLHAVGDDLSGLIGQKNKADIKNYLQPLVEHYPDFSRKHLVAVLYFRGLVRGREHQLILQRLTELKKKLGSGDRNQVLFGDMQVTINTDCLSNLSCCPTTSATWRTMSR
ncbi:exocyst complex component 3-like protein 4 isoform X2 [Epinephelus lanceolatus]